MKKEKSNLLKGGFDLIGDIHGHAAALRRLLGRLGYEESEGCYRHPERRVIFLGDFIDRGPAIRETLRIVRSMIDAGAALAVMGNHEFNALCYHTTGADGAPLRAHSDKNRQQHQATLDAFADHPDEWRDYLAWFRTLPLFLELADFRVVHAAWNDLAIADLDGRDRLDAATLHKAARRGTTEYDAVEILLKGREIELPDGYRFADKHGVYPGRKSDDGRVPRHALGTCPMFQRQRHTNGHSFHAEPTHKHRDIDVPAHGQRVFLRLT
jgi:Calcineurin-like phosphoesterase